MTSIQISQPSAVRTEMVRRASEGVDIKTEIYKTAIWCLHVPNTWVALANLKTAQFKINEVIKTKIGSQAEGMSVSVTASSASTLLQAEIQKIADEVHKNFQLEKGKIQSVYNLFCYTVTISLVCSLISQPGCHYLKSKKISPQFVDRLSTNIDQLRGLMLVGYGTYVILEEDSSFRPAAFFSTAIGVITMVEASIRHSSRRTSVCTRLTNCFKGAMHRLGGWFQSR